MEVLGEEFSHPSQDSHLHSHGEVSRMTQVKKFLLVIAGMNTCVSSHSKGMVLMGLASVYAEHEHGHGGSEETGDEIRDHIPS